MLTSFMTTARQSRTFWLKFLISTALFIFSGTASSYLYYRFNDSGGAFMPGLLYTSSTILIFLSAGKSFSIKNLAIYYALMNLTYLVLLFLTFFSSYFGFFVGIVTGGIGAMITFYLTGRFISNIKWGKPNLFILGGLAFLITDILYFTFSSTFDKTPIEYLFRINNPPATLFVEVFIFWHSIVGTRLSWAIHRS